MEAQEIFNLMNIIDAEVCIPSVSAVTTRRIDGDGRVFRPVTAIFADSKTFSPFHAIKRRIGRLCLARGTKLCGGFAVPDEHLDTILAQIKVEQTLFKEEKQKLVNKWPGPVNDWIDKHPAESFWIEAVAPKAQEIAVGLSCEIRVFKIATSSKLAEVGIEDGLLKQLSSAGKQILQEIEVEARNSWRSRQENGSSTQEIRKSLLRWMLKVEYLTFLDSRLVDVAKLIKEGISRLPASGKIEGHDFLVLSGLMNMLCNSENLLTNCTLDIGKEIPQLQVPQKTKQPEYMLGW